MKREAAISLSIAVLAAAFFLPKEVRALNNEGSSVAQNTAFTAGQDEAMRMVPASATLDRSLDARKAKQGQQIKATLEDKVQLKNGPELPRGTELIGTVATDEMHTNGASRLALRFTQANLKDGKVVPIKATIVSVYDANGSARFDPNIWTPKTLQVDQEHALSGVDLHSKIADGNSGVFVSASKDDVKLPIGYGIALAIAARPADRQSGNGANGGA